MKNDVDNLEQRNKWEIYSKAYNILSDKMIDSKIDIMFLRKVTNSLEEYLSSCQSLCQSEH